MNGRGGGFCDNRSGSPRAARPAPPAGSSLIFTPAKGARSGAPNAACGRGETKHNPRRRRKGARVQGAAVCPAFARPRADRANQALSRRDRPCGERGPAPSDRPHTNRQGKRRWRRARFLALAAAGRAGGNNRRRKKGRLRATPTRKSKKRDRGGAAGEGEGESAEQARNRKAEGKKSRTRGRGAGRDFGRPTSAHCAAPQRELFLPGCLRFLPVFISLRFLESGRRIFPCRWVSEGLAVHSFFSLPPVRRRRKERRPAGRALFSARDMPGARRPQARLVLGGGGASRR